ncbi:multidrug efflux pump acriflavin resistance protein AcrB/AcrD/AcrF [Ameyamaea chiangmaiensis NBRC 103196]|uniref:Efflux RND transporter periplasmic adaptor subunit n=1 Tax=Ameyamaea chiangmaiensis TaxID=442969 RepID=A0A850P9P6_9PROT|nr:efflux RND transporter periplasmic adaptor subunit [Ameyamaea chiangmaiensis]MBS4075849.1 efflux RND transporter periplasmic adaptor subunit [Ameyamaea chiangmaiensis]NVN39280.1 efflux RND transporter periplasmic adaptor subunit [Ameyamaea chiangmaiensis]GBQ63970.1 multidrug efflux pump acriflavin resistance protein AcrB/AcrD/AcrF [Ameyamaea chiangmaiensis NBRC 103196]
MASLSRNTALTVGVCACAVLIGYQVVTRVHAVGQLRAETTANAIPDVAVIQAKPAPNVVSLTLPGNLDAWYQAPIYPQASGYVKMWYKDYGADVHAGDVLAEINAPGLDAQYAQAKADLAATVAKYNLAVISADRWRAMSKSQAVSGQSVSVAEANEKASRAAMEAAQHNVDRFDALERFKTIVAPFDGVVTSRNINVGDYVSSGAGEHGSNGDASQLFTVSDMHKMRLFVSVPETFSYILKPGMTAEVSVPQFPGRTFKADFLTIAKGYDPNTRTAVTEFTIDNDKHELWPGTFGSVTMTAPALAGVFEIPTAALVFQEKGMQVGVVDANNIVHYRNIDIGRMADTQTDVLSGISASDRIINNPPADLLEGQKVHVVVPVKGYDESSEEIEG